MNKLILSFVFAFVSITGFSQKVYFVYLQTEAGQPFFVKINGSLHSSTASGYLILSKLHDSTYEFTVGFPQNKWPEQKFSVIINKKDHGYLVKNFGDKGWGLFDLQSMVVQMGTIASVKMYNKEIQDDKDVSVFTAILSKAADDPSIKEKNTMPDADEKKSGPSVQENVKKDMAIAVEEPKTEVKETTKPVEIIEQPVVKKDVAVTTEQPKIEIKEQPFVKTEEIKTSVEQEYKPTVITKRSESSTTEGFGLVYIDDYGNGKADTIRLLIPNPKPVAGTLKEIPKEEKKFLNILPDTVAKAEDNNAATKSVAKEDPVGKKSVKNSCSAVATQNDFLKLRKNMAVANSDDNMVNEAGKSFKTKCFTTEQLKNLSLLFLNDAGKYKFFDLAYSYVTDAENFAGLQSELKDEYYINRFKAMLRN